MRLRIPRPRTDIERLDRPLPASMPKPLPRILRAPRPRAPQPAADPLYGYRLLVARTLVRHASVDATTCACGVPQPCAVRAHAARLLEWV
jgi:hypothetical protein